MSNTKNRTAVCLCGARVGEGEISTKEVVGVGRPGGERVCVVHRDAR